MAGRDWYNKGMERPRIKMFKYLKLREAIGYPNSKSLVLEGLKIEARIYKRRKKETVIVIPAKEYYVASKDGANQLYILGENQSLGIMGGISKKFLKGREAS